MLQSQASDSFEMICKKLERLADLKEKHGFDNAEVEYEDMRRWLLAQLKESIHAAEPTELVTESEPYEAFSLPYSQLHMQIVQQISAGGYSSENEDARDEEDKVQMLKSLSEMAERRILYPGDSQNIEEIIQIVYTPLPYNLTPTGISGEVFDSLLKLLQDLNRVQVRVRGNPKSSPAAKAIVEITNQSAYQASEEIRIQAFEPAFQNQLVQRLWRNLVIPDLKGGINGGGAASMLATAFLPASLAISAAIGIVIGAGVGSGTAYRNIKKNRANSP